LYILVYKKTLLTLRRMYWSEVPQLLGDFAPRLSAETLPPVYPLGAQPPDLRGAPQHESLDPPLVPTRIQAISHLDRPNNASDFLLSAAAAGNLRLRVQ